MAVPTHSACSEHLLILRRTDFLDQLTEADYSILRVERNFLFAPRNTYVYYDARLLNRLFFVKEGYVKIGNIDEEGDEIIQDILKPGDVFGQFSLEKVNLGGEFAQAYKGDVTLCSFSIQDFENLLRQRPELGIRYSKKIGLKLRHIQNRLLNLLQKDARSRMLYFFYTLLSDTEVAQRGRLAIENYFTHEDIARLTGTSRQTVTTLVNQFASEGILFLDRKHIVIPDVKNLVKEAKVG